MSEPTVVRALILDDGNHEHTVVIDYGIIGLKKESIAQFVGTTLAIPHDVKYVIKTAHLEDLYTEIAVELFEDLDALPYNVSKWNNKLLKLWRSEDLADGADLY